MIVEVDEKNNIIVVFVMSFMYERKLKIYVMFKKDWIVLNYNVLVEGIFIVIVFKVLGGFLDYEIM